MVPDDLVCGLDAGGEGVVRRHAIRHEEGVWCHALQLHLQLLPVCCANARGWYTYGARAVVPPRATALRLRYAGKPERIPPCQRVPLCHCAASRSAKGCGASGASTRPTTMPEFVLLGCEPPCMRDWSRRFGEVGAELGTCICFCPLEPSEERRCRGGKEEFMVTCCISTLMG